LNVPALPLTGETIHVISDGTKYKQVEIFDDSVSINRRTATVSYFCGERTYAIVATPVSPTTSTLAGSEL